MNCQKLHSDIEKLKSLRDELSAKLEESTESGFGKAALSNLSHEASNTADEILEHYTEDIIEQNINDKESRNSEFLNSILEQYWQEQDQIDQSEVESTPESLITPDTTIDQVRNNLSEYLKSDKKLDSNLLVYVLKERLNLLGDNSTNGQNFNLKELEELCKDFLPDKTLPRLVYLHKIAERVKNLEVLETESYIFMLPKDKWEQGKIKLPNPNGNPKTPEFIAPSDLTAILKSPVYYDWSYETDGQLTGDPTLVYDEKWVGKEIKHFPWSKELFEAEKALLKPNGYHIPIKNELVAIYNNTKNELAKERNISPEDIKDSDIVTAFIGRYHLAFSGYVDEGELRYVGDDGFFWSASVESAGGAWGLYFVEGYVDPSNLGYRGDAQFVRCVA